MWPEDQGVPALLREKQSCYVSDQECLVPAGVRATGGCHTYSQAEATVVTLVILVESSDQGWRFWRAKREELWTQMGSAWMGWLMVFWKASCCNCMRMRFACCRSASRSSAVCLLGEREPLGGLGGAKEGILQRDKVVLGARDVGGQG